MLKNFLKIALRNILKNKIYAFINITGLSVGTAIAILILLFVQNELSFDSFNKNGDRIYRVITEEQRTNGMHESSAQPLPLGPAMVSEFSEIKSAVRFVGSEAVISNGTAKFNEGIEYTDPDIFSVFSFPLLEGNPSTALTQPNSVVLAQTEAVKFFGKEDPIDKTLIIYFNNKPGYYKVTGVLENVPENSSIKFKVLIPISQMPAYQNEKSDWNWSFGSTFIMTSNKSGIKGIRSGINHFIQKYYGDYISGSRAYGLLKKSDDSFKLSFEPLKDVHFSKIKYSSESTGNPIYSYVLSIIAFIILLIACINFITLSVGKSASRVKEVGVRKVLGAKQNNIAAQFWIESILLTLTAFIISLALVELLLPVFNQLTTYHFNFNKIFSPGFITILTVLILVVGLFAGSYPSFIMSRFKPAEVLKGKMKIIHGSFFSKVLVVIQFSMAIILITGTLVVWLQLKYIQNKNLGYNGNQVIVVPVDIGNESGGQAINRFKNKMLGHSGIINISGTNVTFGEGYGVKAFKHNGATIKTYIYRIDENYIPTLGLHLIDGSNFAIGSGADSLQDVIINEAFAKDMGWKTPIIGKEIKDWDWEGKGKTNLKIIGVVKNYNFLSLHAKIAPVILNMYPGFGEYSMLVKISKENIPTTISYIKNIYEQILPDKPFNFTFLNDDVQNQYNIEMKLGKIVGISSILAILISCLGLFGLTLLSAASRTKEVGIRKVLGASVKNIFAMISKDFLKLVLISNVIAWPIAWYAANKWLQDFAYKINISVWIFLLSSLLALLIVFVTISFQAIKSATANPVKSLRYE